jgi:hypothetical protein
MSISWQKRFRITFEHDGWRFSLRVVVGFVLFYLCRKWESWIPKSHLISQVAIGWIPWRIQEGQSIPAWNLYYREERLKQIYKEPK